MVSYTHSLLVNLEYLTWMEKKRTEKNLGFKIMKGLWNQTALRAVKKGHYLLLQEQKAIVFEC